MKIRSFLIFALVLLFVHDNNGKKDDHNISKRESNKDSTWSQGHAVVKMKQGFGKQSGRKKKGEPLRKFGTKTTQRHQAELKTEKTQQPKTLQSGSKKGQIKSDKPKKLNMPKIHDKANEASATIQPASSASVSTSNTTDAQSEPSTLGRRVSHGMPYVMSIANAPYEKLYRSMNKDHHFFASHPERTQEDPSQSASEELTPKSALYNDNYIQSIISSHYVQPSMEQAPALTVLQSRSSSADIGDGTLTYSSMSVNVSETVNTLLTGGMRSNDTDSIIVDILDYFCNTQSSTHQSPIATPTQPQPVALDQSSFTKSDESFQTCDFLNISNHKISSEEIKKLSESLFNLDKNNGYKYVSVNLQSVTKEDSIVDDAPTSLLSVNQKMYEIRTIKSLLALYDNYELDVKKNEAITSQESKEESELLDTFMETDVFKETMKFLDDKKFLPSGTYEFKDSLKRIWFTKFKRVEGEPSSSGFEALFLAEKLGDYIIGPQNWIYYAKQEESKKLDYHGYIKDIKLGEKAEAIKIRTAFNIPNTKESATTLLVGLSPELEMALYTLCFYVRPNDVCSISLGGKEIVFVSTRFNYFGKDIMISSFVAG